MQRIKYTLKANQHTTPSRGTVYKGWSIVLNIDDPQVADYDFDSSFKKEIIDIPDRPVKNEEKKTGPGPEDKNPNGDSGDDGDSNDDSFGGIGLEALEEIKDETITLLQTAGLGTVESIIRAGKDKLITIKGIGESTANKLMEAANHALKKAAGENEE